MKKEEKKEVAVVNGSKSVAGSSIRDLSIIEQDSSIRDLSIIEQDSSSGHTGFENIDTADVAIPFLSILQSLSPQVKKGMPQRIEGAEEGMFFNNVTQEVMNAPIKIIPCAFTKAFVEWISREQGGGFVKQHESEEILKKCKKNEKGIDVLIETGNDIIPTAYHYVLIVREDGRIERCVISFTRTQLKKSRRWLGQMMNLTLKKKDGSLIRPPMFSHYYEFSTTMETKDQYSWFGFSIGPAKIIEDANLYLEAKGFNQECASGSIKIKEPVEQDPGIHPEVPFDFSFVM